MYKVKTEIIKNYMTQNCLTVEELAKKSKIYLTDLEKILKNSDDIKLLSLLKVLRVINVRFLDICYNEI